MWFIANRICNASHGPAAATARATSFCKYQSCRNTPPRDALAPNRDPACHEKTKGKRRALQTRTPVDQGPDKRCQDTTDPASGSEFTAIFRPLFRLPMEKRETKSDVNAESM